MGVGDHSEGQLVEASSSIIHRRVRAQGGKNKKKNKQSTKRNRKGKEIRQEKKRGKGKNNDKKKHKGRGKNKTKKKKRPKKKTNLRQSCSSNEVNRTCMKNALEGMMFEKN